MASLFVIVLLAGLVLAWHSFVDKRSGGRMRSPLWMAFTFTTAAILFLVAGAVGYKMRHGVPFMNRTAWTDSVIWPEIWTGLALALVAAFLWRRGLRSLRRTTREPHPSA